MEEDSGEKTEEPSQYRLEEFREKGQVASSKELTGIFVLSASIVTVLITTTYMYEIFTDFFWWVTTQKVETLFLKDNFNMVISKCVSVFTKSVIPVMITALVISIASNLMQIGFIFSTEVLSMKWERVNPLEGIKRFFSKKVIFDTIKNLFKFILILAISYSYLKNEFSGFKGLFHVTISQAFAHGKDVIVGVSFLIILGLAVIAFFDFVWEKYQYRQKLLLTRQQAKEELKEKEGNPEIRQRIRALQREMAFKRMMADVPKADVIISNPTHISVALKYDREAMVAPQVLAKGADEVALKIRKIAKEHDIPIVENVLLARTLYQTVKIGEIIPRTLYKAVADIISYVYRLKNKKWVKN